MDDQQARDLAYDNSAAVPGSERFGPLWEAAAAEFRAAHPACALDQPYGDHPRARFDLFHPEGVPNGLMVYVHGGYWRMRSRSDWSHFASGALARGWSVAMIGYPLCPEVRLSEITSHIARGIADAAGRVAGPIAITGHSAGGHLTARMCMEGVLPDALLSRVSAAVPISGLSDLRPFLQLSMNAELRLDPAEAEAESPVLGCARVSNVTVAVGGAELPAFLDQSRLLIERWNTAELILPGRHHFDVIDGLRDPDSALMAAILG